MRKTPKATATSDTLGSKGFIDIVKKTKNVSMTFGYVSKHMRQSAVVADSLQEVITSLQFRTDLKDEMPQEHQNVETLNESPCLVQFMQLSISDEPCKKCSTCLQCQIRITNARKKVANLITASTKTQKQDITHTAVKKKKTSFRNIAP